MHIENCLIVVDDTKGRCLQSKKSFSPGNLIFEEEALVFAKYTERELEENHVNAELLLEFYGKKTFDELDEVHNALSKFDKVQSLDTARCLLQLVAETYKKSNQQNKQPNQNLVDQLTANNTLDCVSDMKRFRKLQRTTFPKSVKTEEVGRLLAVLNTNQLELEEFGGSGLFPFTAILEHSCFPNCSYTSNGNALRLTAIKNIDIGDRLSIDYGNYFYDPTNERRDELFSTYGFWCLV